MFVTRLKFATIRTNAPTHCSPALPLQPKLSCASLEGKKKKKHKTLILRCSSPPKPLIPHPNVFANPIGRGNGGESKSSWEDHSRRGACCGPRVNSHGCRRRSLHLRCPSLPYPFWYLPILNSIPMSSSSFVFYWFTIQRIFVICWFYEFLVYDT